MLKGLDPLLNADLLHVLQSMGHGDELAIVDRNYPAASTAQRLLRLDGADVVQAAGAIFSLLPIDDFVEPALFRLEVVGEPARVTDVQQDFLRAAETAEGRPLMLGSLERNAFYQRSRQAYAVVATSETRPYGCFIVIKGVIPGA